MEKVISKDGTPIAVDRSGSGPALILVDGAMCSRGFGPMPPLAKALASAVHRVSLRSPRPRRQRRRLAYDVQREIEDLDAVVQKAGGSAMVFGISSGAALAAEAARQLRGIRRLALYEAPYVIDDTHEPLPPTFIADTKALVAANRRGAAVKKFMRYVGTPAIAVFVMSLLPFWKKLTKIAHTLSNDLEIIAPHHIRPAVSRREMVDDHHPDPGDGGRQEPGLHAELDARAGRRRFPNAVHQTLAGQTHMVKQDVLLPELVELLRPCIRTGGRKRIGPSTLNG